jgi:hypothetical protein
MLTLLAGPSSFLEPEIILVISQKVMVSILAVSKTDSHNSEYNQCCLIQIRSMQERHTSKLIQ